MKVDKKAVNKMKFVGGDRLSRMNDAPEI